MTSGQRLFRFSAFLAVPALLYFTTLQLREGWGLYYFSHNADPAYLYLINSLNIATLHPVQHVDNPGTTVQLLGGIVIRAIALLEGVSDIEADVFQRPEYYLTAINRTLFGIILIAIYFLGFITCRLTQSIWAGMLLQCAPFGSYLMLKSMLMVSPEPMSVVAGIFFALLLIWAFAKRSYEESPGMFATVSAMIVSFALATKITFIPFVLLPLILLNSNKWRALFLLLTILIFHIILIPAYVHYDFFLHWIKLLILHSGNYGQGTPEILNAGSFMGSLLKLVLLEHTFFITLAIGIFLLLKIYLSDDLKNRLWETPQVKILLVITTTVILHVLLVAKHYNPRYLIPPLMLFPVIIYFIVIIFQQINEFKQFRIIHTAAFKAGLTMALALLFILRHFSGYLPGDTFESWQQITTARNGFADWIPSTLPENGLFALILALALSAAGIAIFKHSALNGRFASYILMAMAGIYHLRHVDVGGFNFRCVESKRGALAIINVVQNEYADYVKIFGGKSSSQLYALKYGTSNNFTRISQLARLNEIYPDTGVYFWRVRIGEPLFQNWTQEMTLGEILNRGSNVIIQGNREYLDAESVRSIESENNVKLEPVFTGKTEVIYRIKGS